MEEDDDDDTLAWSGVAGLVLDSRQGNPGGERAGHAGAGDEEERAAADAVDEQGEDGSLDPVGDADDAVELVLELRVRDANVVQDLA